MHNQSLTSKVGYFFVSSSLNYFTKLHTAELHKKTPPAAGKRSRSLRCTTSLASYASRSKLGMQTRANSLRSSDVHYNLSIITADSES
ncbi:hypothetical protein KC19_6G014500 [Ceratodon purpureus]|uniref:Uncharacterized protein n=1 Tax=Ceratodon purpureus TaxID=3225 RepID=A0A8T0HBS4_CERPU|nr:hypothetical protein KC19_6G014500 [Ceratodon purpureus]